METNGFSFTSTIQEKILALVWTDSTYFRLYSECVKPKYFHKAIHIDLCRILMSYYEKYNCPPTKDVFIQEVYSMCERNRTKHKLQDDYLDCIDRMSGMEFNDYDFLKDKIIEFGKKQAMIEAIMESAEIIEKNSSDCYHQVSELIQKAQMVGEDSVNLGTNYWDNYEERIRGYSTKEDVIERFTTGMGELDTALNGGIGRTEMAVILAPPGRGKALHPDTPVLTPDGYVPIKCLKVGDYVISVDGSRTKVNGVFHHDKKKMYKVKFLDGSEVICCDEHLWNVQTRKDREHHLTTYKTVQLKDMLNDIKIENGIRCNYSIPVMSNPCELNPRGEITLDPWLLGAFIGDGCSSIKFGGLSFNNTEKDILLRFNELLPDSMKLKDCDPTHVEHSIVMKDYKNRAYNEKSEFRLELERLGLYGKLSYEKFIPEPYLYSSPENRLKLLQGLLDTDGWVKSKTSVEFSTSSLRLAKDVKFLAESLGCFASEIREHMGKYKKNGVYIETRPQYTIRLKPLNGVNIVSSDKNLSKMNIKDSERRFIESAHYIGDSEAICISVEHPSKLYVIKDCIVTHNTTSLINSNE